MSDNPIKDLFVPDQATIDRVIGKWSKRKLWTLRIIALVFLSLWFGLWFYLHEQVKQGQAKVERKRIEASRRQESARRQAAYQQVMEQYQKSSHTQTQRYGR